MAAGLAAASVTALWVAPRAQPATGTLVVLVAGRTTGTLPRSTVAIHGGGGWVSLGDGSGTVPAAPRERQLVAGSLPAGAYDAIRIGQDTSSVSLSVAQNQAEPVLLGIDEGRLIPGSAYAGNDQANLGLGELSGKFVPMPAFGLVDQGGARLGLDTIAGHDVVIAAFHTSCHETCPLYTALFLQLARQVPPGTMLLEVTTDPATDSPAVLAGYAAQVAANWTFATGTQQQLAEFWKPFKVDLAAGDTHASTLALVDRHGYIRLVYRGVPKVGNEIPPSLVTSLSALGLHELATGGDGWGAPDLLQALTTISGPAPAAASRGGQARDFTLTSTEGAKVSLSDFAGTPLVLNFWATYCPPCRAEMPMLQQAISSQPRARLILVDEGDGRDSARAFLQSQGIHGAALLDSDGSVLRSYGLSALPTTIFIRSDGTVDRRQVGQLDPSVLAAEVSSLTSQ